ncbi:MAG: adenylosuccinate lyase [Candidatus Hadarchaeales archaeon]
MAEFGYETFLSPFTWRYGSKEMKRLFSEVYTRTLWRKVWLALAEAQAEYGLISQEELEDIRSKSGPEYVNIERAHEVEREIRHDLMAEIKVFAEQCPVGGGKIHLGATSMDIEDNADAIRIKEALDIILTRLINCLDALSEKIIKYKDLPCLGWTHIQPAEPTTLGYRLAFYAQDLVLDVQLVEFLMNNLVKGKGIKGAVGTSASFKFLLGEKGRPEDLEKKVMEKLGISSFHISTQTYPRKLDFILLNVLASIAQSAHKFGLDFRLLQSPAFGEISEPMKEAQVGSSAMPFKKNPVSAERMCSLARYVSVLPKIAWDNASQTILERTLDDSANRRIVLAEAFLAIDECLIIYAWLARGMIVYPEMIKKNLEKFAPFAAIEPILMRLVELGEDRQKMHEYLREISRKAWEVVMRGEKNPLHELLSQDMRIKSKLPREELDEFFEVENYIGDAPERCEKFVKEVIKPLLQKYGDRVCLTEGTKF